MASSELEKYSTLASSYKTVIGVGFIEHCPRTGLLYNSYVVFGRSGETLCHYRKIQAEPFCSPGNPDQRGVFDTPWGPAGLLICSDSYQGLLARKAVLEGARLLLIPANWPAGRLDPELIWQARARENGVYVAVCNRTGKSPGIDFNSAKSFLFSPDGGIIMENGSENSAVFTADLPLDISEAFPGESRAQCLAGRTPGLYYPLSYDRRHFNGKESVCHVRIAAFPTSRGWKNGSPQENASHGGVEPPQEGALLSVLPPIPEKDCPAWLAEHAHESEYTAFALAEPGGELTGMLLKEPDGAQRVIPFTRASGDDITVLEAGPLRLCPARLEEALQPEFAYAASKLGADVLMISEYRCPMEELPVLRCLTTAQVAVVLAADTAMVCAPSKGHQTWPYVASGSEVCALDVELEAGIRRKFFQDRINFEVFWSTEPS